MLQTARCGSALAEVAGAPLAGHPLAAEESFVRFRVVEVLAIFRAVESLISQRAVGLEDEGDRLA